ncbi:MAG: hypothetical protein ABIF09_18795 [Gemmatimonadota bacterium]
MQPILISFSVILIGVVAAVLLFSVAMRGRGAEEEPKPPTRAPTSSGHFFLDGVAEPVGVINVPADALRLQLERHVRLEQQAAEGFLRSPSASSLQAPSASALRR